MSEVSLGELIRGVEDTERKLRRAEEQLSLLQNALLETERRYERASVSRETAEDGRRPLLQASAYSTYLKLSTQQGVAAMYQHYTEVHPLELY